MERVGSESLKHRVRKMHFKPEGYVSSGDIECLKIFLEKIGAWGFEPDDLVFSGFDGASILRGEPIPQHPSIYAMNEAGWRMAIKGLEANPAEYAEGWETPCIGLYDKSQLAEVYSADFLNDFDDMDSRVELGNVSISQYLADLGPEVPVEEALVHKNYPEGSPIDALVGLVYIDK